jgi:aryl-alcohol dehydrogenase-like predicted oxidoreductase
MHDPVNYEWNQGKIDATGSQTMELKQLGNSDMWLTPIGFGAWAVGGGNWAYSWGPQDDQASIAAIRKAIDLGINWIDTAAIYGLGHSETIVGQAVKQSPVKPYVFTKSGMVWDDKRGIRRTLLEIRREVEDSLHRLQVETIDLYQIHWPVEDQDIEEGWTAMADLKREGKVRHIGVSNFSVSQMERCLDIAPIASLQPPYSLLNRAVEEEILPYCMGHAIGVINYSPQVSGLLTGAMTKERVANLPEDDFRRNARQFQEPLLSRNLALAGLLGQIGARRGVSAGVVAIAWTLANPAITAAIVGGRSPQQVEGVWPAVKYRLTDEEIHEIQSFMDANP